MSGQSTQIQVRKNQLIFSFLIVTLLLLAHQSVQAQAAGDYRSAASTAWNLPATWERFDGAIWQPNPTPPISADGVITIQSPHNVAASSVITADQVIVDAGATLTVSSTFTIADGTGDDLTVNGTLTNSATIQGDGSLIINNNFVITGIIQGNGGLTVNGNTTWNSGTLDRTFTNQATRIMDVATSNGKTLNAPLTNAGALNWMDGQIIQNVSSGGSFTNNATMTISSNALYQDNNGNGFFTNTGTITKTSGGTTTFSNLIFSNSGMMNFDAGVVTFVNSGSITNTGTINLTMATLNNNHTFHHNIGSVIAGSGSFVNTGTLNLNIDLTFPASIPFSTTGTVQGDGNLIVNNNFTLAGTIQGNGSLTVNGNITWNSGTLDRTFTNQATRIMDIATGNGKTLNAPLTNAGTLNWMDGQIIQNVSSGGSFTNNATMTISSNALYQDNNANGFFTNNGTITKTSSGTTTLSNLILSNTGTMNFNAGTVTFVNSGSITNTGTINLTMATLNNNHTFHHNTGSVIAGSGSFVNTGTLNLNIDLTFPASIPFSTTGTVQGDGNLIVNNNFTLAGTIQGNGSLTVNGNTTWNSGTLDRTFTNQATRIMDIATGNGKTLNAPLVNAGTLNWLEGQIVQHMSIGGSFTNNATMTISSNALYQDNNGNGFFTNTGTITKTSGGTTTFSNLIFSNSGTMNFDAGAVTFVNSGSITNTGTINLTMATLTNNHTFNHNTGSVIQGSGSFVNGGTLNLNIDLTFPASIPFSTTGTVQGDGNLIVNNNFTLAGTIQGNGSLTVNGNTTWNSGTLDRTFTNQATRIMDIATGNGKTLNAPLVNAGTLNWLDGQIVQHVSSGGSFTNNATMTISSNALYQDNNGNGVFTNTGTITKTSGGTTTFSNLIFSNPGTMNFNAGAVTFGNSGSITNTGTISLTMATLTNNHTFNHNAGSVIQGSGSFVNGGTLNLNIDLTFPASIPFSTTGTVQGDGNLTVNNNFILAGTIQGNGSLTVNGNTTWNSGTLDRTFTNQATRIMDIATSNGKILNAPLVNAGTLNWLDGQIVQHVSSGGSFTNNATMTISSNALYQDNNGNGFFTNTGTITKTSGGTTTFSNLIFSNPGTMNFDAGAVTFVNSGSITNTGAISLTMATLTNNHTFHHNTGSVIAGSGSFVNGGTLNLNIDLTFPASIPFSTTGTVQGDGNLTVNNNFTLAGTIQGNGSLTVNGNTTWNSGTLDRTFTNQATRIMDIATGNGKTLNAPLTNAGTLNWIAGQIVQHQAVGGSFTNNATMTISSNALYQDNNGNGPFANNGTITKTSVGTTTLSNLIFLNSGTVKGVGTIDLTNGGSFTNTGSIAPGLSPGILAVNNRQLFSAASTLSIEVVSDLGPGTGHDQLQSNMNPLTLNGTLAVDLLEGFEPIPGASYTVLTYPSKTGTFSTEPPCWLVTYNATSTSIAFNPAVFTTCAMNIMGTNTPSTCGKVVNYVVEAFGTPTPTLTYAFTGATTGNGMGTGSGSTFNVGVTNVTILANNGCSDASCSFTVTIADTEVPISDCPDNITQGNSPGQCGANVNFSATAMDNCGISSITYNPTSGSFFAVGTSAVTATVTDLHGHTATCTFNVTVNDTEAPTIDCPDNVTVSNALGTCGATVNYSVTFDDNCPGESLMQTMGIVSGGTFPIGVTTNVFCVTDAAGNSTTCSFTVTVNDTELPTINCPNNVSIFSGVGICGAVVNFPVTFDDNCSGESLMQATGLASGATFPIGMTTNTFKVTDASGNTQTCSFTVTIIDNILPTIDCPDDISVDNDSGECGAVVNYSVTTDDNCPGESLLQLNGLPSGSQFPVGTTTNTFRVTDASGNSTTCSFDVIVTDAELPSIDCPDDVTTTPGDVVNYSVLFDDNCPGAELEQTAGLPSGSMFPPGLTTNTFVATDAADNTSECSFTVTAVTGDTLILCPDDVLVSTVLGECSAVVGDITPTVFPDGLTFSYTLSGATIGSGSGSASGLAFDVGVTTVTYTLDDNPLYMCSFTVTVQAHQEICNDIDDDCDGLIDDEDPDVSGQSTWYADSDEDGYGDPASSVTLCGQPDGYVSNDDDCDDTNQFVNPSAVEGCNDIDDDCDGLIDDDDPDITGQSTWYADTDGDGFGDPASSVVACDQPEGYVANDDDCDDTDENVNPDAVEVCNDVDDDCDGLFDDEDPDITGQSTWYEDTDGDGFGDPASSVNACDQPEGYVSNDEDCDDSDENVNPDATEICNGIDDDCNGSIDENPGSQEICNGIDDDCDGLIDDEDPDVIGLTTWYADTDGDGYGTSTSSVTSCGQPVGYVANDDDCDDTDENVNPGETEVCNGIDDDCDGMIDEGVLITWYQDFDGDAYGNLAMSQTSCTQPPGYVLLSTDCNDNDPAIHPGATELCNGVNDDCDAFIDEGCPGGELSISIEDTTTVLESAGIVHVQVQLTAPSEQIVRVSFRTQDGTAKKNLDYRSTTGILTFQPGQVQKTIRVQIIVNGTAEPDEHFFITLFNPQNAPILNGIGVVIITETPMMLQQMVSDEHHEMQIPGEEKRSSLHSNELGRELAQVVVPNPQSKYSDLQVLGLAPGTSEIRLLDLHGRIVVEMKRYENDWQMSGLSPGIYLYQIVRHREDGIAERYTGKLVIID